MQNVFTRIAAIIILAALILPACSTAATPPPVPTDTPKPTSTNTAIPTDTSTPTRTPRPTSTPNLAQTQKYEDFNKEIETYYDQGYLDTTEGKVEELDDFSDDWAQLGWYRWAPLNETVDDFFLSAHFKWTSAYRSADLSGCGFAFAIQDDNDHYAVFLDRSKVYFVETAEYYRPFSPTRGTARVDFGNPFDQPVEADFALIVKGTSAYVLVDGELLGEYTLAQSKNLRGGLGLTLLSGTNKDFGTRCEMTDIHVWTPWGG